MRFAQQAILCAAGVVSLGLAGEALGVVARVGDSPIGAASVLEKMRPMLALERSRYGHSPAEAVRGYVDQVLVRDALFANEASSLKVGREPLTRFRMERAMSRAVLRQVETELGRPSQVLTEEVRAYYVAHKEQFSSPEKIGLFRILLPTKAAAIDAISRLKRKLTVEAFTKIAREESLDKATYLRAGSLGMVAPDGASTFVHVRADKAVIEAARSVKDGELVLSPVAEGEHFAVVWRRGSVPEARISLEASTDQIRQTLWRQRFEQRSKEQIDSLRVANVKRVNDGLVAEMDPPKVPPPMVVRSVPVPAEE
jgi:peptidyl-prolyl cis-trans isomerase C